MNEPSDLKPQECLELERLARERIQHPSAQAAHKLQAHLDALGGELLVLLSLLGEVRRRRLEADLFELGRAFQRELQEESAAFENSYGRGGEQYPETPEEDAERVARFMRERAAKQGKP